MTPEPPVAAPPAPFSAGRSAPPLDIVPPPSRWTASTAWPRWLALVLSAWLLASAFLWPHARAGFVNASLFGVLLLACGVVALFVHWVRGLVAVVALWLAAATLITEHVASVTMWSDLAVAIGVLAMSLLRSSDTERAQRHRDR